MLSFTQNPRVFIYFFNHVKSGLKINHISLRVGVGFLLVAMVLFDSGCGHCTECYTINYVCIELPVWSKQFDFISFLSHDTCLFLFFSL